MKYTRLELKNLVKECLIEILSDGLGTNLIETTQKRLSRGNIHNINPRENFQKLNDQRKPSQALVEAVKSQSKGNPLFEELLADTAATTLQAQLAADSRGGAGIVASDPASFAVANSTPEQLFGNETTSKWADLAFAQPTRNRT